MSADFKLDRLAYDLSIGSDGRLAVVAKSPEVAQRVGIRLRRQLGEWFLNTLVGLPWYDQILGGKDVAGAELLIRREILATVGVSALTQFTPLFTNGQRELSIYAQVYTTYGQPPAAVRVDIGA